MMDTNRLTRVDATTWRIEPHGTMRVSAVIYADENLIRDMDDKVYEQAANVATLPGIVQASYHARSPLGLRLSHRRRGGLRSPQVEQQPAATPGAWTARSLFLWRSMSRQKLFSGVAAR
jgi:hypothetical protein